MDGIEFLDYFEVEYYPKTWRRRLQDTLDAFALVEGEDYTTEFRQREGRGGGRKRLMYTITDEAVAKVQVVYDEMSASLEGEEWRTYVHNARYEVSTFGRVRGLYHRWGLRTRPWLLTERLDGQGYVQLRLYEGDGRSRYPKVHRMVLETFAPNAENLPVINHKDEDKTNNRLDNLEWCTLQYNAEYTCAKHYMFRSPEGEVVEVYNLRQFCKENSLTQANMAKVLKGERKHHKGWEKV